MQSINNMDVYPTFAIITPSYNQGEYIEDTIKSVISQEGDFYLDYIIVDGDSTDNTISILKKYEKLISEGDFSVKCQGLNFRWLSEKDKGQANAINKGFKLAVGDIITWINSDDYYYDSHVLDKVKKYFMNSKEIYFIYGNGVYVDKHGKYIKKIGVDSKMDYQKTRRACLLLQPATFYRKAVLENVGLLNEEYRYGFDWDFWIRLSKQFKLYYMDDLLSCYRLQGANKTTIGGLSRILELKEILRNYNTKYTVSHFCLTLNIIRWKKLSKSKLNLFDRICINSISYILIMLKYVFKSVQI